MVWASFSQWHVALSIGYPGGVPPFQWDDTEVKMQTLKQRPLVCGDISGPCQFWMVKQTPPLKDEKLETWKYEVNNGNIIRPGKSGNRNCNHSKMSAASPKKFNSGFVRHQF